MPVTADRVVGGLFEHDAICTGVDSGIEFFEKFAAVVRDTGIAAISVYWTGRFHSIRVCTYPHLFGLVFE